MSRIAMNFFSEVLRVGVSAELVYPADSAGQIGVPDPGSEEEPAVLYLLHGLSDDHTAWLRYTSIERYARRYNLAVVMPAVNRSFYRDMANGPPYWTYVSEELPAMIRKTYRVTDRPERTFIAGLSMGGYGAMLHAFTYPDRYAGAASFSGAVDMGRRFDDPPEDGDASLRLDRERRLVFGENVKVRGSESDLFALASSIAERGDSLPELYLACGSEDFLIEDNERFHAHLQAFGLAHEYRTEPGAHDWSLWDRNVDEFLRFLEGKGRLR